MVNPWTSLQGKKALITGSSAGIGLAIGEALQQAGVEVALNGRDAGRCEAAAQKTGAPVLVGDVGEANAAESLVARASEALGGLDILINNAGWGRRMELEELDPEAFEAIWRTNVLGGGADGEVLCSRIP